MNLRSHSLSRFALVQPIWSLALLVGLSGPSAALADPPRVQFDVPYVVAARDITSCEFELAYPHEKLIELKLQVSSLLQEGSEADLRQYLFSIVSPQRTMSVVDYLPKTAHETPIAGNLAVVPAAHVTPLAADSAEVMAFIVSGGVTGIPSART